MTGVNSERKRGGWSKKDREWEGGEVDRGEDVEIAEESTEESLLRLRGWN